MGCQKVRVSIPRSRNLRRNSRAVQDAAVAVPGDKSISHRAVMLGSIASGATEEEFMRAITLALFDYLRKSRSRGFVLSISGGADSAAAASRGARRRRRLRFLRDPRRAPSSPSRSPSSGGGSA